MLGKGHVTQMAKQGQGSGHRLTAASGWNNLEMTYFSILEVHVSFPFVLKSLKIGHQKLC